MYYTLGQRKGLGIGGRSDGKRRKPVCHRQRLNAKSAHRAAGRA
ncbi:MAG: hypothetical protein R2912_04280 [Eubacteriales bacterium]